MSKPDPVRIDRRQIRETSPYVRCAKCGAVASIDNYVGERSGTLLGFRVFCMASCQPGETIGRCA